MKFFQLILLYCLCSIVGLPASHASSKNPYPHFRKIWSYNPLSEYNTVRIFYRQAESMSDKSEKLKPGFLGGNPEEDSESTKRIRENYKKIEDEYLKGYGKSKAEYNFRLKLLGVGTFLAFMANNYRQTQKLEGEKLEDSAKKYSRIKNDYIKIHSSFMSLRAKINCVEEISHGIVLELATITEEIKIQLSLLKDIEKDLLNVHNSHWIIFKPLYYYTRSFINEYINSCKELKNTYEQDLYHLNLVRKIFTRNFNSTLQNSREKIIDILNEDELPDIFKNTCFDDLKSTPRNLINLLNEESSSGKLNAFVRSSLEVLSFIYLTYPEDEKYIYDFINGVRENANNIRKAKFQKIIDLEKIESVKGIDSIQILHNIGYAYMKMAEIAKNENDEIGKNDCLKKAKIYLSKAMKLQDDSPFLSFMPYYSYGYLQELKGNFRKAQKKYKIALLIRGECSEIQERIDEVQNKISQDKIMSTKRKMPDDLAPLIGIEPTAIYHKPSNTVMEDCIGE